MLLEKKINNLREKISPHPDVSFVFNKIIETRKLGIDERGNVRRGYKDAIYLANKLGIRTSMVDPAYYFSWDGQAMAIDTDTSVIFHEIAHWQLASEPRRTIPDFGLGAGPETGNFLIANRVKCLESNSIENEECLASLLGILWEVYFGLNAIDSLIEQSWLELSERDFTSQLFIKTYESLKARFLIDSYGDPTKPF